jgi:hypothetical protein
MKNVYIVCRIALSPFEAKDMDGLGHEKDEV